MTRYKTFETMNEQITPISEIQKYTSQNNKYGGGGNVNPFNSFNSLNASVYEPPGTNGAYDMNTYGNQNNQYGQNNSPNNVDSMVSRSVRKFDNGSRSTYAIPPEQNYYNNLNNMNNMNNMNNVNQPINIPDFNQFNQYIQQQQQKSINKNSANNICQKVQRHLRKCPGCKKRYSHHNMYITIIMGLVLFIMFLLTKIIDKFGK